MEGLIVEVNRNKELLQAYKSIHTGVFGALMIEADIKGAEAAMGSGDVVEMVRYYNTLKQNE